MIWKKHTQKPLEAIARTGFLISFTSYNVFWVTDLIQPGFVSRYFSVHIFLLAAIIFAVVWSRVMEEYTDRPIVQTLVALTFGVFLAVLTWDIASDLDLYRLPLVLIAAVTPLTIYSLIRS
jgi:hypothetical protein